MSKKTKNKSNGNGNAKRDSTKPVKIPKNINRNGKNNMRLAKIDKK